ncbi:MAG: hypothetical protein KM296_03415 [Brockia lithotrophica]|nr:hypothetical protein [Brockia lithotrophica]
MIVREIARRLAPFARDLRVVDYGLCLLAAYVVVEGPDRRRAFGAAHIPHEDIHRVGRVHPPNLKPWKGSSSIPIPSTASSASPWRTP